MLLKNLDNIAIKIYNRIRGERHGAVAPCPPREARIMPTTKQDYYQVLGVSKTASEKEIRQA